MKSRILRDAEVKPELFVWRGPLRHADFESWLTARQLVLPGDLTDLLVATGGGDVFETESILGPLVVAGDPDSADEVNAQYRAMGLPKRLWLFHVGITLSAVDLERRSLVTISEAYAILGEFDSLDTWYTETLREEFAARYNL